MTTFNFSPDDTSDELTLEDSPIDDLDEDTDSVLRYIDGTPSVGVCDSTSTYLNIMDTLRRNTGTGMPKSKRGYSPDQQDEVSNASMAGEGGLHLLYDEWQFDDTINENGGDGGVDGQLRIDGELLDCDVKTVTPTHGDDPWLKVLVDKRHSADAFILASYEDGDVRFHGWVYADDLLVEETTSWRTGQHNHLLTPNPEENDGGHIDMLNEMPEPTTDRSVKTSRFEFSG